MKKSLEKALYSLGINISFYDTAKELNFLEQNLPASFKSRDIIDIGCGDGVVTLKLKKILEPNTIKGIDSSKRLISSAIKKNINAEIFDIENQEIEGDLGILWGVLHHFSDPEKTVKKIKTSFKSLIIREPIDEKRIFELGTRMNKEKLLNLLAKAEIDLKKCKIFEQTETKGLIIFIGS